MASNWQTNSTLCLQCSLVHFYDNDRDEKLSSGDQFIVYGTGNSANGPAEDDWTLEVQFDASGDVIGTAKLLGN